ncbi:hypothetical protein M407DRAFT_101787 [Tulasnella calospora MUT 4182]|uniref:Secreted protein n=1 Tax=Tulasnella calospora MUT 4182 TaxID=1051891 RepID=A0A0C3KSH4_9AGAM|nr:hypothetical protein M407DRAFT_101787 [Tulasnella calospora MUT 4182]
MTLFVLCISFYSIFAALISGRSASCYGIAIRAAITLMPRRSARLSLCRIFMVMDRVELVHRCRGRVSDRLGGRGSASKAWKYKVGGKGETSRKGYEGERKGKSEETVADIYADAVTFTCQRARHRALVMAVKIFAETLN